MKYYIILIASSIMLISGCNEKQNNLKYPLSKKVDTVDNYFGTKVPDPYRWLENDTAADVAEWVKAENKVTFDYLNQIPFREKMKERLTAVWNFPKQSAPFKKGDKFFCYKNNGLQNQSILYIMNSLTDSARVLLDPNTLSDDGTVSLASMDISPDGKLLAYAIARGGSDWNEIYFLNIETGKLLDDHLNWVKFSGIGWFNDGIYYSGYTPPAKGKELSQKNEYHKLYYHKLGTEQIADKIIIENKKEPLRNFYASVTDDQKYLIISEENAGSMGNALHVYDLLKPNSKIITIVPGFDSEFGVVDNIDSELYIRTNLNAKKYKLIKVNVNEPDINKAVEILPETNDVLSNVSFCGNTIIANYMKDAHSEIKIYEYSGKFLNNLNLPALGTVNSFNSGKKDAEAFYDFTSYNYPTTVFQYDYKTGVSKEFFKPAIDFDGSVYEVKQVFYESKDKTKISMFIVSKKGIKLDGNNPTLLYGYGGFNISLTPGFSTGRILWLENGGVYAVANLRGGGEYGEEWHLAGTKLKKQNVFDDFIAAAEYLIKENYTSPDYLAIQGGSNGGLLVGAVANQRPDLFKVALPAVGVMDMLRYHKFTIGWSWVTDYGNSDNKEEFEYIYKYSPIHNIKENVEYPAIMVTTADHDDRVVPAHSFKYIATLQEKYKGSNPVLIRIETSAGHGAGKPTSKQIDEAVDIYSFIFKNMGITPKY
ncbi:MAG: S9 family peptidase [Bacteroidia bacterium]|nr:S9 family peptidase [Bacteroidia bacterium]